MSSSKLKYAPSGATQVSACLTFESPPPTPEHMRKYRKKHNQVPGIKVIHHGLRDQKLPDASHVYGVKLSEENVQSAVPAVTKMFAEGHETELGQYIKAKDEINYKRHKLEPLGKSTYAADAQSSLPSHTKHADFKFGQKTERSEAGTKELIEIDPEMAVQPTFASMPREEAMAAQREVIQKRDYHYDWAALGRDPATTVFGKAPRAQPKDASEAECVANSLRFECSEEEMERPLNAAKQKPRPEEFVYGVVTQKAQPTEESEREWGVKQCVHSDVAAKPNVLRRDLPEHRGADLASIYGAKRDEHIPSRLNPKRVTAGNLVNPTRWSEMGVHREHLTEHRDFDAILEMYAKAGFAISADDAAKIKSALDKEHGGVCSLHNFEAALKALQI